MKLNGWHRLWVTLSGAYFAVVAVFAFNAFPQQERIYSRWATTVLELIAEDASRNQAGTVTVADLRGAASLRGLTDKEIAAKFTSSAERADASNPDESGLARYRDKLSRVAVQYEKELMDLRSSQLATVGLYLIFWIVPVMVVLAVGHAVAWVIRGFKKAPIQALQPTAPSGGN